MIEINDEELELLRVIFTDNDVFEYIDSDNENCPYRALFEKIMGDTE